MKKEFDIGGFVNEYVLEIPDDGVPFECTFPVTGEYEILSFEKIWDKIHLFILSLKKNPEKVTFLELFFMGSKGDVPEEYNYVCSGQDFGCCVGAHHKTMHLFMRA